MPVATGYVRLATLEWANEVAKAARGTTSVATIEPPEDRQGRQPHAPGSVCLAHARAFSPSPRYMANAPTRTSQPPWSGRKPLHVACGGSGFITPRTRRNAEARSGSFEGSIRSSPPLLLNFSPFAAKRLCRRLSDRLRWTEGDLRPLI